MNYFMYLPYFALLFCITMCFMQFLCLLRLGAPKDLSEKSGSVAAGVRYSNTTAMLPAQKESAYKHLPTYTAGILFHLGSFLTLILFLLLFFVTAWDFFFEQTLLSSGIALFLWLTSCCGTGLIIKRLISKKLRPISNIDDYLSVILTTLLHIISALLFTIFALHEHFFNIVYANIILWAYFIIFTPFFLYLPFGKLKHAVYYFAARYHLGFFYGRRGTWPPSKTTE